MNILVPNLGSTSLKYKLFDANGKVVLRGKIERIGSPDAVVTQIHKEQTQRKTVAIASHSEALVSLLQVLQDLSASGEDVAVDAIALKAVHAGPKYRGSFLVDDDLLLAMEEFQGVAPLHNSIYIDAIRSFRKLSPNVPMIAVLETAFHSTMPEYAQVYGVPYEWANSYGIRRYGFHGASHSYIAQRVPQLLKRDKAGLRVISCHLGGSSSICALRGGESVDCSFGFSPQSGLEHATRSGDLDPFVVSFVSSRTGEVYDDVLRVLTKRGGLLGISGLSGDCRDLESAAAQGHTRARLALDTFAYTARKYIGAFVAVLGGMDALVFAGGIGENSSFMRQQITEGLRCFGVEIDPVLNTGSKCEDCDISAATNLVRTLVIATDEELVVARNAADVLRLEAHRCSSRY